MASVPMPALDICDVTKTFDRTKVAVDRVSLSVEPGDVFGLLGPNGAGKSTLLRMAVDIIRPDSGKIRLFDHPPGPGMQARIGYLPEDRGLYPRRRVCDILRFLGELKGLAPHVAARRAEASLDRVGLLEALPKRMRELSKGQQQKVQIAAVLLAEPDLLLLDEPFEGLDPVNQVLVGEILKELSARGAAVILSSHRMEQVEAMCRRVFLIDHGREVLSGAVNEIKERFAQSAVTLESDLDASSRPDVERAEPAGAAVRLWLKPGATPEAFLASILAQGARVRRFERALPSLNEIFVKVVRP